MNSSLYHGYVYHRRHQPVNHSFTQRLQMACLDLDELPELLQNTPGFGPKWWHAIRFKREDYLGQGDLKQAVQNKVAELSGQQYQGRVLMLCQLRCLGVYFSPVNFYYLFDQGGQWRHLLAEVSNTPWNQRHYYAIPAGDHWLHPKAFHVSPFNPMEQQYHWQCAAPEQQLRLHIGVEQSECIFEAGLTLQRHPISSRQLLRSITMPFKILAGIYSHALRLWLKSAPLYSHPGSLTSHSNPARSQHVQDQ